MRKIVGFATILAFIATSSLGFAKTKMGSKEMIWVSGKVASVENGILSLREPNGQIFIVAAKGDRLKGIHTGERVVVKDVNGWAVSIKETGKRTAKGLPA